MELRFARYKVGLGIKFYPTNQPLLLHLLLPTYTSTHVALTHAHTLFLYFREFSNKWSPRLRQAVFVGTACATSMI